MDKLENMVISVVKSIYFLFIWIFKIILTILGFVFYPIKERFFQAAKNLDFWMSPYKNPNYHEI